MIYCVEDDASIRDLEVYTLCSTGFAAQGFRDGKELFEAIHKQKPELIVLDIMLPGDDGVQILHRLKNSSELDLSKEVIEQAIEQLGKGASIRGEALTLEEFAKLANIISDL